MLAKIFNTTLNNISNKYFPFGQNSNMKKDIKETGLIRKVLNNTLFLYDSNNFKKFWYLFLN